MATHNKRSLYLVTTGSRKLRRKAKQEDSFDFSQDAVMVSLSIDSVRQLYSGDAADFVEDKILPNAEKTMAVLTDQEQAAARLLLSALIGFLAAEAPMDEQSFPMVMELLNCMEGEKEDGCQDAVLWHRKRAAKSVNALLQDNGSAAKKESSMETGTFSDIPGTNSPSSLKLIPIRRKL